MKTITAFAVGLALTAALPAAPAQALNLRSFVSSTGSDAYNCSLAAPCRHLQAAVAATAAGGEINILDAAGYNGGAEVTIDRAISIVNAGGFEAGIFVPSGGTGIVINAPSNASIHLRGLTIEGGGVGTVGIQFNTGRSLTVINAVIRNTTADGLRFIPATSSYLFVSNSFISDNGSAGISIYTSSAFIQAAINRVETNHNTNFGILVNSTQNAVALVTVTDSAANGNGTTGYYAQADGINGSEITLYLNRCTASNNSDTGVRVDGAGAAVTLMQTDLTNNNYGDFTEIELWPRVEPWKQLHL